MARKRMATADDIGRLLADIPVLSEGVQGRASLLAGYAAGLAHMATWDNNPSDAALVQAIHDRLSDLEAALSALASHFPREAAS